MKLSCEMLVFWGGFWEVLVGLDWRMKGRWMFVPERLLHGSINGLLLVR